VKQDVGGGCGTNSQLAFMVRKFDRAVYRTG